MPEGFHYHAKTAAQAIRMIKEKGISFISFDHDLGEVGNGSGYQVAKWIEVMAYGGALKPLDYAIHSANPVGRINIDMAMRSAQNFWKTASSEMEETTEG